MEPIALIVVAVISYLLGSISFARLIPRLVDPKADLSDISLPVQDSEERMPMLAMGANTASIKYGSKVGCSIGLLDMLKVFLPTLAVRLLYPGESYYLVYSRPHGWDPDGALLAALCTRDGLTLVKSFAGVEVHRAVRAG